MGRPEQGPASSGPENHGSVRVLLKAGFERVRFVPALERDAYQISAAAWENGS
jgi:hypothetical protein